MTKVNVPYLCDIPIFGSTADKAVGIVRIDRQSELLTIDGVTNVAPEGITINMYMPIRATTSRKYGIVARHLVLGRVVGEAPNAFIQYRKVVILTPSLFYNALAASTPAIQYENQSDWSIINGRAESYHISHG